MSTLQDRLAALPAQALRGMRCGIEKEGLRALPDGSLALTPHPLALGAALTHPLITTDYSESQLELITGAHHGVQACLDELTEVHQFVQRTLAGGAGAGELLWASSMPCGLPTDETIPLARYGSSNIGRAKSVYRMGLGHRYGRRMQTISGIHYNWSLPGLGSDQYFALIRNFRRHAFVLLYLFGASPALCPSFVAGRTHGLQVLGGGSGQGNGNGAGSNGGALYLPHATSLRMGRLGYQSDAQATLAVSYNGLQGYANSLHAALTRPYPAYEAVGLRNPGGDYNQLGTSLLQIENEFYGSIRPKRSVRSGERPLHALRERGVEYVEVRLMDLDPFIPAGISAQTMRLLDVFLLHCLLCHSPPDTPDEIAEIKHNQQLTAERGREPGLRLQRRGHSLLLGDWAEELLAGCAPLAAALDALHASDAHASALHAARALLTRPEATPSARVLERIAGAHGNSFVAFGRAQSLAAREQLLALPWSAAQQTRHTALAAQSLAAQKAIEAADTQPFETWREQYMAVGGLG